MTPERIESIYKAIAETQKNISKLPPFEREFANITSTPLMGLLKECLDETDRLRKAIEDVPMCRSNAAFPSKEAAIQSHNLRLFEWKRNALEGE